VLARTPDSRLMCRQQLAAAAEQQGEALRAARERAARQGEADVDRERAVAGERARLAADQ